MRSRSQKITRLLGTFGLAILLSSGLVSAHHSVTGQFDESKSMTLTGTISRVEWINPHPYVHLEVKDKNGVVTSWALSTIPIPMLRKAGLTKERLTGKVGEAVTITALPPLDARKRIGWISKITYADGHFYLLFE